VTDSKGQLLKPWGGRAFPSQTRSSMVLLATVANSGRTPRMNKANLGFLALVVIEATSCGPDDGGGSSSQHSDALVEACSGTVECTLQGEGVQEQLKKQGNSCYLGDAKVNADGTVAGTDGSSLTWKGDVFKFDLCSDGTCLKCMNLSPPDVPGYACRGVASSCSSLGAGSCATQSGCSFTIGATLSSSDDECYGSADGCSEFKSTSECEWQRGCNWAKE
jgi:hypothetical protein